MVLVLCISDLHIPHRASDLPPRFKELLQPGKIHHILCPGNLCCRETLDFLKKVCSSVHLTKGDFDDLDVPEDKVINIESFKIGLCHGHQVVPAGDIEALAIVQRRLDVDILITGHTHKFMVHPYEDRLLMNPGSATGADSLFDADVAPSFILMDITGPKVDVYHYHMVAGESKVKKMEFVKPTGAAGSHATLITAITQSVPMKPEGESSGNMPLNTTTPEMNGTSESLAKKTEKESEPEPEPEAQARSQAPAVAEPAQIQAVASGAVADPVPTDQALDDTRELSEGNPPKE